MDDDDDVEEIENWSWQGVVALALAIGVFLTTTTLVTGFAVKLAQNNGVEANPASVGILTGVLSILIGSLATTLGKISDD